MLTVTAIGLLALVVSSFAAPGPTARATQQVGSRPATPEQGDARLLVIARAQRRLHNNPADQQTWAELGSAYLLQAQSTGDPLYYPKAEGALRRSLALDRTGNWAAMAGLGALANARHDFRQALSWARRAAAVHPHDEGVQAVTIDALTQLGDYPAATAAVRRMLDLRPGVAALVRAAELFQELGETSSARQALRRALAEATDPSDIARCRHQLGDLAFREGRPKAALTQYQLGLDVAPRSDQLLAGRARAEVALGRKGAALHDYARAIDLVARPRSILEHAELLLSLGRDDQAEQQFALLAAEQQRLAANGVVDDLLSAVVEADHGMATAAVRHAQAEWSRRQSVIVADALGWALHRAGRDHEALRYATRANRLGGRNASFRYHLSLIELALDRRAEAHRDLHAALAINPYFSVLQAPVARRALAASSEP